MILRVPLNKAQEALTELKPYYDSRYKTKREDGFLFIPLINKVKQEFGVYVKEDLTPAKHHQRYQEALQGKLTEEELEMLPTSFEIVGDILILDLPDGLKPKKRDIGAALLAANKNIKTILMKTGQHEGEFRTIKLECIAGEDKRETIHKENNIRLKLDVEQVYFSARSSTERKRICSQVKKGENVLVMFSGCGPFTMSIAKNTDARNVVGVEKNPIGHKYALENARLNKIKCDSRCGDVRDVVPTLGKFDRILMPLPKDADTFLDTAFLAAKKGTMIHMYDFEHESETEKAWEKVVQAADKEKICCKHIQTVKCGQYSPGKFRLCVDFQVL
ncbi:MAG: class I SAM-dependent methyltransferase family protein [Nanoarchaeota archaeon]|nr:class I SAM-dependent methyltransferase family protein [Nanoarchaeota archaeon]